MNCVSVWLAPSPCGWGCPGARRGLLAGVLSPSCSVSPSDCLFLFPPRCHPVQPSDWVFSRLGGARTAELRRSCAGPGARGAACNVFVDSRRRQEIPNFLASHILSDAPPAPCHSPSRLGFSPPPPFHSIPFSPRFRHLRSAPQGA